MTSTSSQTLSVSNIFATITNAGELQETHLRLDFVVLFPSFFFCPSLSVGVNVFLIRPRMQTFARGHLSSPTGTPDEIGSANSIEQLDKASTARPTEQTPSEHPFGFCRSCWRKLHPVEKEMVARTTLALTAADKGSCVLTG